MSADPPGGITKFSASEKGNVMIRFVRRSAIAGVLGGATALAVAAPASAHYVYQQGYVYARGDCTQVRSEISHGSGGGYSRSDVRAKQDLDTAAGKLNCFARLARPAGYLAVRYDLYRWSARSNKWYVCAQSSWHYNKKNSYSYAIATNHGTRTLCGDGYYGTMSYGHQYNDGWKGGALWSGYHHLATSGRAAAAVPTNGPGGAAATGGTVSVANLTAAPVIGTNGVESSRSVQLSVVPTSPPPRPPASSSTPVEEEVTDVFLCTPGAC